MSLFPVKYGQTSVTHTEHDRLVDRLHLNKLLVPLDGSSESEHSIGYAMLLSRLYNAEIQFLHVLNSANPQTSHFRTNRLLLPNSHFDRSKLLAQSYLDEIAKSLADRKVSITCGVSRGRVSDIVTSRAITNKVGLVVLTHRAKDPIEKNLYPGVLPLMWKYSPIPILCINKKQIKRKLQISYPSSLILIINHDKAGTALLPYIKTLASIPRLREILLICKMNKPSSHIRLGTTHRISSPNNFSYFRQQILSMGLKVATFFSCDPIKLIKEFHDSKIEAWSMISARPNNFFINTFYTSYESKIWEKTQYPTFIVFDREVTIRRIQEFHRKISKYKLDEE